MRFGSQVVSFEFAGVPIVGNYDSGYLIGLTPEGSEVCLKLFEEDVPEQEIIAVDKNLFEHLNLGGFFSPPAPSYDVPSAYLHVTQRCNLECAGCYSDDSQRNTMTDAPLEYITHAIDELAQAGVKRLVISGGEPFLRSDLAQIVRYAKEKADIASINVLSNGTCIDTAILEDMVGFVDLVSVSFDGCSPSSPAYIRKEQRFDDLVDAVKAIQAAGIPAHIIPTVHAKNLNDINEYVALSKQLGVTMNFSVLSCESTEGDLKELIFGDEELHDLGTMMLTLGESGEGALRDAPMSTNLTVKQSCGAGCKTLSIAADGTVYPCHMLHRQELEMGNLFKGTIEEVSRGKMRKAFDELNAQKFERCGDCRYLEICGGGCRARALYQSGTLRAPDPYCRMITTFYDALANKMKATMQK